MAPDGAQASHRQCSLSRDALREILKDHHRYVAGWPGGRRADLRFCDLQGLDLTGVELGGADLTGATPQQSVLL